MFFKKKNNISYFLFFVVFCFSLLIFDFYYHISNKIRFYTDKIIFSCYFFYDNLNIWIKNNFFFLENFKKIQDENFFLKKKYFFLKQKVFFLNILKLENNFLRKILNFPLLKKIREKIYFIKVFFYRNTNLDELIIDHLFNKNIKYGSLLFNNLSIIGKVIYTGSNYSKIELICNKNSSLPVIILRNNINTIINGNNCSNDMRISDFSIDTDVHIGDIIVLPNIDGYIFTGYPIGVVKNVILDSISSSLIVDVKYFLELQNLNFVFIYN